MFFLPRSCPTSGGLLVALAVLVGCSPGDGVSPPGDRLYFPVGLAVDESSRWLYVVNSDFDLQFNQGTVQTLDLERIRGVIPQVCGTDAHCAPGQICDVGRDELGPTADNGGAASYFCVPNRTSPPCGAIPESTVSSRAVAPGRCAPIPLADPQDGGGTLIEQTVTISAFGTDVLLVQRPADAPAGPPSRLFIPVRSDRSLHWIDADGSRLECGQEGNGGSCDDRHRVGQNPEADNSRGLELPTEPFGIAGTADGRVLVVAHQVGGRVSAFVNDWANDPRLEFVLGGLPTRPIGIASLPQRALPEGPTQLRDYEAGFLVTFRSAAQVNLLRFFADEGSSPQRPYLVDVGQSPITINTLGIDSRGIAVHDPRPEAREQCDALSPDEQADCLVSAESLPLDVFIANRTPPSLLVGRTQPVDSSLETRDLPTFYENVPLTAGPSRVVIGDVLVDDGTPEGRRERRVFVICFDSNLIYVYDPERGRIETEIFTGRGPHAIAFDRERPLAYVGHFTESYIGVVSLDGRSPWNYGAIIASIGVPSPPRASK